VFEICYGRFADEQNENQMMKTNSPPLPLAGEGWGEGGQQIFPLTFILSPMGEEIGPWHF
jgi:hypothetical protein